MKGFRIWAAGATVLAVFGGLVAARAEQAQTFLPARKWAIVIGASRYTHLPALRYSATDAEKFAGILKNQLGFEPDRLTLLSDAQETKNAPTVANIRRSLQQVLSNKAVDKSDLLIFFFSGHGTATASGDYLLPTDAELKTAERQGIAVRELVTSVVKAGLKNVLFIVDACRSGAKNDFGAEFQELGRTSNVAVLLGCQPGRRSYEEPRFQSGVFTHFLIEAMGDAELRNKDSGALWASKVAEKVASEVYDYTEPDYGAAAQKPAPWTEGSQDVMLSATVDRARAPEAIRAFTEQTKNLDPQILANAYISYAEDLFVADQGGSAVELLKTVDRLGLLTPYGRYLLGFSLWEAGRSKESMREFDELGQAKGDAYYSLLGQVANPRRSGMGSARAQAAKKLWELSPDALTGVQVIAFLQIHGTPVEQLEFERILAADETIPERIRLWASALVAQSEGRERDALQELAKAAQAEGEIPNSETLTMLAYQTAEQVSDHESAIKILDDAIARPDCAGIIYALRSAEAKAQGDEDGRLRYAREAFSRTMDPDKLLIAIRTVGIPVYKCGDLLRKQARQYPYSWKARLVEYLVASFEKNTGEEAELLESMTKYADDELNVMLAAFPLVDALATEVMDVLPDEQKQDMSIVYRNFAASLMEQIDDFGDDPAPYLMLIDYGFKTERQMQIGGLVCSKLAPRLKELPDATRSVLCVAALGCGDTALVDRIRAMGPLTTRAHGANWMIAMDLVRRGDEQAARDWMAKMPPFAGDLGPMVEAFRVYMDFRAGKKEDAVERISHLQDSYLTHVWAGAAMLELGDKENGIKFLSNMLTEANWSTCFVDAFAAQLLQKQFLADGDTTSLDNLVYRIGLSYSGHPYFAPFAYSGVKTVSDLAGNYDQKVRIVMMDGSVDTGTIKLKVKKDGKATLELVFDGGKASFSGAVDAFGNLTLKGTMFKTPWTVTAKIAPADRYKSNANLRQSGQVFELISEHFDSLILVGIPMDAEWGGAKPSDESPPKAPLSFLPSAPYLLAIPH